MTAPTPPPAALRDILARLIREAFKHDLQAPYVAPDLADAILSDPRIAVVQLPEAYRNGYFRFGHGYANTERAEGCAVFAEAYGWPIRIESSDDAVSMAAALLAAAAQHNNINRGDQS